MAVRWFTHRKDGDGACCWTCRQPIVVPQCTDYCEPGTTPAAYQVTLAGVQPGDVFTRCPDCPDWNGTYVLPQVEGSPCLYELADPQRCNSSDFRWQFSIELGLIRFRALITSFPTPDIIDWTANHTGGSSCAFNNVSLNPVVTTVRCANAASTCTVTAL